MITIVDYGMGNLGSVYNMLRKVDAAAEVTGDHEKISKATKMILPGVGAFDAAMQRINESGLKDILNQKALVEKIPVLGICLGMQLLTNGSEEGQMAGLGWIAGEVKKIPAKEKLKVPHMGWNVVHPKQQHTLLRDMPDEMRFYFVHSYYVQTMDVGHTIATANYGLDFAAIIANDNIMGAQFHPERSHKFGVSLFRNFIAI